LDYVLDLDLLKTKKGRRKKKRLCGVMDECNGYGDDMYDFGDFNEAPAQVHCSKCHKTGHTAATHDKHMKAIKLGRWNGSTSGSKRVEVHRFLSV
jgi:hypothetical protein